MMLLHSWGTDSETDMPMEAAMKVGKALPLLNLSLISIRKVLTPERKEAQSKGKRADSINLKLNLT